VFILNGGPLIGVFIFGIGIPIPVYREYYGLSSISSPFSFFVILKKTL